MGCCYYYSYSYSYPFHYYYSSYYCYCYCLLFYYPFYYYDSDYVLEPEVTIRKEETQLIEEYRVNGQLYMIKVSPKNMPSYYLYKDDQGSDWTRHDSPEAPMIVPQWVLFTF